MPTPRTTLERIIDEASTFSALDVERLAQAQRTGHREPLTSAQLATIDAAAAVIADDVWTLAERYYPDELRGTFHEAVRRIVKCTLCAE
jgi:hypothetical protein